MPDTTPRQQLWSGLAVSAIGVWLGYTVWSGMPGWRVPPLVGYAVAGSFLAAGLSLLLQRAGRLRAATVVIFLFIGGLVAIGGWIGFGAGERSCTANGFLMGEMGCRVVFGGGAVVTAVIAILVFRSRLKKAA
ncbi:MAG: hypothetical protein ABJC74_08195 [Gemmatimonadota bacterium]